MPSNGTPEQKAKWYARIKERRRVTRSSLAPHPHELHAETRVMQAANRLAAMGIVPVYGKIEGANP